MSSSEGFIWIILPNTTLLSISAKVRRASSDFQQVRKKKPLLVPSYSLGSLILMMLPKREKAFLISSSVSLQGMLVMQRRLESIYRGFVTNFLFLQLILGALMNLAFICCPFREADYLYLFLSATTFYSFFSFYPFPFLLDHLASSLYYYSSKCGLLVGRTRSSHDFLTCSEITFLYFSKVLLVFCVELAAFVWLFWCYLVLDRSAFSSSRVFAISIMILLAPIQVLLYLFLTASAVYRFLKPTKANLRVAPYEFLGSLQSVIQSILVKCSTTSFQANTLGMFLTMILLMQFLQYIKFQQ